MGRRRLYTREFKESAIELYRTSGKTRTEVANELGINPENICRWLRESEEGEKKNIRVFPGQGNPRDEELSRLRKENTDLREANEILKKAMAFFVVKTPQ
jgi:transposase-like protein